MVLKSAEGASLTLVRLAELCAEAGLPEDFLNVVTGTGAVVGEALDQATEAEAISSSTQLEKDIGFIDTATAEGGRLETSGARILRKTGGYYLPPTVFGCVIPAMTRAQQVAFGPVLAVMRFSGEDDALRIANSTAYGLASAVWTAKFGRAHRIVRGIRAGVVHVNTYGGADGTVPLGGMRQSGNGHDKSLHALDKYSDIKTAWLQL